MLSTLDLILLDGLHFIDLIEGGGPLLSHHSRMDEVLLLVWIKLLVLVILVVLFDVDIRRLKDVSKLFYFLMVVRVLLEQ